VNSQEGVDFELVFAPTVQVGICKKSYSYAVHKLFSFVVMAAGKEGLAN